ncbi:MAG: hypothetical protein WAO08_28435, partial [Hyphomicrobiaceae bacterium]
CKGSNTCSDRRPKRRSATVETYVDDAKWTKKGFVGGAIRLRNSGGIARSSFTPLSPTQGLAPVPQFGAETAKSDQHHLGR